MTDLTNAHKLRRNVFYNLAGLLLPTLVGIVTIPPLMHQLGLTQFGLLTLLWVFLSYASLLDLGLGRAVTQQLSFRRSHNNPEECANLVWSSLYLLIAFGFMLCGIIFLFRNFLSLHFINAPPSYNQETIQSLTAIAFSLPLIIASDCLRGVLESHHAFGWVNCVRLPMGIFTFAAPLVVFYFHGSLTSIAWTLAIGKSLTTLIYFLFALRLMPELLQYRRFILKEIQTLLSLGSWMTISNILSPILGYIDRFFIATISLVSVSYYVTPNEIATKLWLIPGAITAVFFPLFSAAIKNNPAIVKKLFIQSLGLIALAILPFILILSFFAQPILALWLNQAFADNTYLILQIFCLGIFINSLAQVPAGLIQAKGRPQITTLILLIEIPFYIAGLYWIVKNPTLSMSIKLRDIAALWSLRMLVDAIMLFAAAKWI
jgi:O-antigen/teichoic acid export membrane protein